MSVDSVNVVELPELNVSGGKREVRVGARLDLVEQLPIRVTVMAGTAEISASRLFQLGSGDVVPLSQSVDQPVDILANGKLIARGVLVAAGSQMGVRITEISPA